MGLITAEEAREYLPAVGKGTEGAHGKLIERASSAIARYLGYPQRSATGSPTIESASYTLYSGFGEPGCWVVDGGQRVLLPVRPLTAITSIYDDPDLLTYGSAYLVTSTDYSYDAVTGTIFLLPTRSHGAFSSVQRAVRVICTAGYTTIPDPIREACILTCQAWWVRRRAGATQEAPATPEASSALPGPVRELLDPYALPRGWVA